MCGDFSTFEIGSAFKGASNRCIKLTMEHTKASGQFIQEVIDHL